ncbi:acetyl-CoA sensor PanZ family protein [Pseudomonas siliginis]|uniref:acetyl-CoA sensor PanZ family protein n=1 Tax=Pseudomonas siliginis TaxID=2842346 RepID=UPI003AFFC07B
MQRHHAVCYLSHLCVRKVTRRFGGAERLVNQAQKMASQAGAGLHPLTPAGHPQAQARWRSRRCHRRPSADDATPNRLPAALYSPAI